MHQPGKANGAGQPLFRANSHRILPAFPLTAWWLPGPTSFRAARAAPGIDKCAFAAHSLGATCNVAKPVALRALLRFQHCLPLAQGAPVNPLAGVPTHGTAQSRLDSAGSGRLLPVEPSHPGGARGRTGQTNRT